jgi:hypothetical protein
MENTGRDSSRSVRYRTQKVAVGFQQLQQRLFTGFTTRYVCFTALFLFFAGRLSAHLQSRNDNLITPLVQAAHCFGRRVLDDWP